MTPSFSRFRVAAKVHLRHGVFTELLQAQGWSQRDLATYLGVRWQVVHAWMKFQGRAPTNPDVLQKLMTLTGKPDDELFPPAIYARPARERPTATRTVVRDVPAEALLPHARPVLPSAPSAEDVYAQGETPALVHHALARLGGREREVLERRFGMDTERQQTLEEVGAWLGVSRERVRQTEVRAMRKLRNDRAIRSLAPPSVQAWLQYWDPPVSQ